jgi:hypothetical protein
MAHKSFTVRPVHASARAQKPNQHIAEEDTMTTETLELNTVAEFAKNDDAFELLALSLDDLDLVGGGIAIGGLM